MPTNEFHCHGCGIVSDSPEYFIDPDWKRFKHCPGCAARDWTAGYRAAFDFLRKNPYIMREMLHRSNPFNVVRRQRPVVGG